MAENSRRTPNQVRNAIIEKNVEINKVQLAIKGAVLEACKEKAELARVASEKFVVNAVAHTLQKLLPEGRDHQLNPTGPKLWMCYEYFQN